MSEDQVPAPAAPTRPGMSPEKQRILLYALGALFLLASTIAGTLGMRAHTFEQQIQTISSERDELRQVSKTAEARIEELMQQVSSFSNRYRRLEAAIDGKGEVIRNADGTVVFNVFEGDNAGSSSVTSQFSQLTKKNEQLTLQLGQKDLQVAELTKKTSRPALSPWEFGVAYSAPVLAIADYAGATYWLGLGYHLPVLGLDLGLHGRLGADLGAPAIRETLKGMIELTGRPS